MNYSPSRNGPLTTRDAPPSPLKFRSVKLSSHIASLERPTVEEIERTMNEGEPMRRNKSSLKLKTGMFEKSNSNRYF